MNASALPDGGDVLNEYLIAHCYTKMLGAPTKDEQSRWFERMGHYVRRRSPERVHEMELQKSLAQVYAKVFTSMWDGSLYGQLEASAVLMACVTLCNAQGVLDMTPQAISGRTGWPIAFIEKGLDQLQKPDTRSRTPDEDGRRMVLLDEHRDWGWLIVNYEKYRTLSDPDTVKEQTRERVRKHRERRNDVKRSVTVGNASKRQAEAEAEEGKRGNVASAPPAAKVGKPKGSKRVPPEFIPDVSLALAKLPNVDIDAEVTKFRDWEFKSARSDWAATWRNWVQSASEQGRYAKKKSNGEWSRVT